jgi:putative Mg2+ transporter-C (MgtC) family protein
MPMGLETQIMRLVLAAVLGGVVGFERESLHKAAGLRTYMLVCIGATAFTLVSLGLPGGSPDTASSNISRVVAAIVTGIGFLGAGTILHDRGHVEGLTTAAGLWVMAALGAAIGLGAYAAALATAVLTLFTLRGLGPIMSRLFPRYAPKPNGSDTDTAV